MILDCQDYSVAGEDYTPLTRLLPQQENIRHRIHEIVTGGDDYAIVIGKPGFPHELGQAIYEWALAEWGLGYQIRRGEVPNQVTSIIRVFMFFRINMAGEGQLELEISYLNT